MRQYLVDLRCPYCGKTHRVTSGLQLDGGPTEPGSLADLYPGGELPQALARLLDNLVWCPKVEQWVNQHDRGRFYLTPRRGGGMLPLPMDP